MDTDYNEVYLASLYRKRVWPALKRATLCLLFVIGALMSDDVMAKIADPAPVEHNGVIFSSHDNTVEAKKKDSGKVIWTVSLPRQEPKKIDPNLEEDVQWIIIDNLEIAGANLKIRYGYKTYFLDLKTGKIGAHSK